MSDRWRSQWMTAPAIPSAYVYKSTNRIYSRIVRSLCSLVRTFVSDYTSAFWMFKRLPRGFDLELERFFLISRKRLNFYRFHARLKTFYDIGWDGRSNPIESSLFISNRVAGNLCLAGVVFTNCNTIVILIRYRVRVFRFGWMSRSLID